jgi:hypothetical protein
MMILLIIVLAGVIYAMVNKNAPLHSFLAPAHYTTGIITAQVIFALAVAGICLWVSKRLNIF